MRDPLEKVPYATALKWTGKNSREMYDFLTGRVNEYMSTSGSNFFIDHSMVEGGLVLKTSLGELPVKIGDYVLKYTCGEFLSYDPDSLPPFRDSRF